MKFEDRVGPAVAAEEITVCFVRLGVRLPVSHSRPTRLTHCNSDQLVATRRAADAAKTEAEAARKEADAAKKQAAATRRAATEEGAGAEAAGQSSWRRGRRKFQLLSLSLCLARAAEN